MKKLVLFVSMLFASWAVTAQSGIQFERPVNQGGVNVFENGKADTVPFDGLKTRVGGAFALQLQSLDHSNNADPNIDPTSGDDLNALPELGTGFNNASANLNIDVQLEDGIRMNLVTYLSSRHHTEAWVKGGYLQIDKMKFLNSSTIDNIMQYLSIRVGHMEINYGDAHFRRTDNGNAMYNPFVGNYIMDAFTTEIGGEIYGYMNDFFVMGGVTNGLIKGQVKNMDGVGPSFYAKAGYDNQLSDDFRLRLTGSFYTNPKSGRNTLYGGDRAGSRYYDILSGGFAEGRINPGFSNEISTWVINPFIKFKGLEVFGNIESATGKSSKETETRTWSQIGGDVIYRIGQKENVYVGGRYIKVSGELAGSNAEVSIDRMAGVVGVFITDNILAKIEYVQQNYNDFAKSSIYSEAQFQGIMLEGVIAF